MDKFNWLYTRMIEMSLDVSKNHVLKKIMNNLNWSSEDTNVFYFMHHVNWTHSFLKKKKLIWWWTMNVGLVAKEFIHTLKSVISIWSYEIYHDMLIFQIPTRLKLSLIVFIHMSFEHVLIYSLYFLFFLDSNLLIWSFFGFGSS